MGHVRRDAFTFGGGSGEAFNEHVLGDRWPGADERLDAELISLYRDDDGRGPVQAGAKVCFGPDEAEAVTTVRRLWPTEQLPGELSQVLPTPEHFEQAAQLVSEEAVASSPVPCGPDVDRHVEALRAYERAGVDELYVQQIGPRQEEFFDVWAREVLPRFHA